MNKKKLLALLMAFVILFAQIPSVASASESEVQGSDHFTFQAGPVPFSIMGFRPFRSGSVDWESMYVTISANVKTQGTGLDDENFNWDQVFGPGNVAELEVNQYVEDRDNGNKVIKPTGESYTMSVTEGGETAFRDATGKLIKLPAYDFSTGNRRQLLYDIQSGDELMAVVNFVEVTGGTSRQWKKDDQGIDYHETKVNIEFHQIINTEMKSDWHTNQAEDVRPDIPATLKGFWNDDEISNFNIPKNSSPLVLRDDFAGDGDVKVVENNTSLKDGDSYLLVNGSQDPSVVYTHTITPGNEVKYKVTPSYSAVTGGNFKIQEELTVTFDPNGGTFADDTTDAIPVKVWHGDDVQAPADPTPSQTGYKFAGWSTANDVVPSSANLQNVTNSITLYAIYTAEDTVIKVNPNDAGPVPEGYKRVTFDPTQDGSLDDTFSDSTAGNKYIYDIKDGTRWGIAKIEAEALGQPFPTQATHKEDTKFFNGWSNDLPAGQDIINENALDDAYNFTAQYEDKYSDTAKDGFAKVEFKADEDGQTPPRGKFEQGAITTIFVNKEYEVNLENDGKVPTIIAEAEYEHAGWNPPVNVARKYTTDMDIVVLYNKKGDIYNADDPNAPDNYILVTFVKGDHGELDGNKYFKVNPEKEVVINPPEVIANDGYKFKEWKPHNPVKPTKYVADGAGKNNVITANYESESVVKLINDPDNTPVTPGYVRVLFDPTSDGSFGNSYDLSLAGKKIAYDVKENTKWGEALAGGLTVPKANYKDDTKSFSKWNNDLPAVGDIVTTQTYIAEYAVADVKVVDLPDDPSLPVPPIVAGSVRIVFDPTADGKIGQGNLGKKVAYDVKINLTWGTALGNGLSVPKANYKDDSKVFKSWGETLPNYADKLTQDKEYTAQYTSSKSVISADDNNNPDPDKYFRVEFDPTQYGKLNGGTQGAKIAYWVEKTKTWAELKSEGMAIPTATYKDISKTFEKWNPELPAEAAKLTEDKTFVAQYKDVPDIVTGDKQKPEGYKTVTFLLGDNGTLEGETVYYVSPVEEITLAQITPPTINANEGYKIATPNWDPNYDTTKEITKATTDAELTFTAQYEAKQNVVKLDDPDAPTNFPDDPENPGNNDPDYITVKFVAGANGSLQDGNMAYAVLKNKAFSELKADLTAPNPVPDANYNFDKWNPKFPEQDTFKYTQDKTYTAQFTEKDKKTVTVEFKSGTRGKTLPSEVTDKNPGNIRDQYVGSTVNSPATPAVNETVEITTGVQGTWTFKGYDKNQLTVSENDADNKFVGTWDFTEKGKKSITINFQTDTGQAVPAEVEAKKPSVADQYVGETVNAPTIPTADQTVIITSGPSQGTWTFQSWDNNSITVTEAGPNEFVGTWTFAETAKGNVEYEFVSSDSTKPLPQGVLDQKPANEQRYVGSQVTPTTSFRPVNDTVDGQVGTWSFTGWNPTSLRVTEAGPNKFIGTWTFGQEPSKQPTINPVQPGDKEITGGGEPGAEVTVDIPGETPITVPVDENGNWKVDIPEGVELKEGDVITATQTEPGKSPSQPVSVTVTGTGRGDNSLLTFFLFGYDDEEPVKEEETKIHYAYLEGYPDNSVQPAGKVTRAEAAALVTRLEGLDLSDTSTPAFNDVAENGWYNPYINVAIKNDMPSCR